MRSEALRNIRTMRQARSILDVIRSRNPRTTNSLSKTEEEVQYLKSLTDRRLEQLLGKERRRFAAQETAINKSRQRMLKAREKLAMTANKNRSLSELRRVLQQTRWEENDTIASKAEAADSEPELRRVEVNY